MSSEVEQLTGSEKVSADARVRKQGHLLFFGLIIALRAKNRRRERPQGDAFFPRTFRPRPLQFEARFPGPCFWTLISHLTTSPMATSYLW